MQKNACVDGIFLYTNAINSYAEAFVIELEKKIPGFKFDDLMARDSPERNANTRRTLKKDLLDVSTMIRNSKNANIPHYPDLKDHVVFFDDLSDHHLSSKSHFIHIGAWDYTNKGAFQDATDYSRIDKILQECGVSKPMSGGSKKRRKTKKKRRQLLNTKSV
jgi:hypothetical protein